MRPEAGGFFARRWQGRIALPVLLWRDMLGVGTLINVLASFLALAIIAQDGPAAWALVVHLAPVPYNLFLVLCLQRQPEPNPVAAGIGALWFVVMLIA